jgi:hypothetical protein
MGTDGFPENLGFLSPVFTDGNSFGTMMNLYIFEAKIAEISDKPHLDL